MTPNRHYRPARPDGAGPAVPRTRPSFLRLPGLLLFAGTIALMVLAAVLLAPSVSPARADRLACASEGLTLPRAVYVEPGVDAAMVQAAMAEWNAIRAGTFVSVSDPADADVFVVPSEVTWVDMPCNKLTSTVHAGSDVDLSHWMAHELGHTLGLADHIKKNTNPARYINPSVCPGDGYVGVMSYCTPRAQWWGPDDQAMMIDLFGPPPVAEPQPQQTFPYSTVIGGLSRGAR